MAKKSDMVEVKKTILDPETGVTERADYCLLKSRAIKTFQAVALSGGPNVGGCHGSFRAARNAGEKNSQEKATDKCFRCFYST